MAKDKKEATKDFLLEIGTEEIPAGYIEPILNYLRSTLELSRKAGTLNFNDIDAFGTPNRIVIYIRGLSKLKPQTKKIIGPSKEVAFDKDGKPTAACLGFLKSKGAKLKDIIIEPTPKGEYVFIKKGERAPSIKDMMQNSIAALKFKFPKTMRWDEGGARFARPIRWVLSLYGSEAVPIKFAGLTASNSTRMPRYLSVSMEAASVKSTGDYFAKLKKLDVVLDQRARREKILSILKDLTKGLGAGDSFNEDLIDTVTQLVESPFGFVGKFDKSYLALPAAVLESSMAKNQKIFLVKDNKGKALNYFVAIINGRRKDVAPIRRTFEAILNAKLKDSIFFIAEDFRIELDARIERLKGVIFQTKLATMYDRAIRIQKLSRQIAEPLKIPEEGRKKIDRAALLLKTDLTTQMVKEFPDLQGIIGREYAKGTNEDKDIANAIYEHYLPKTVTDPIPASDISCILAMADKLDLIVGFFAIGLIPTGSEDPYGIRRASLGLLKILCEKKYSISLEDLIDKSFDAYSDKISCDKNSVKTQIMTFLKERLKNILLDKKYKDDIIESVLCPAVGRFDRLSKKLDDLSSILKAKYLLEAAKVIERTSNILKADKELRDNAAKVRPEYFKEQLEKDLWEIYEKNRTKIEEKIETANYIGATKAYAEAFYNPIHLFFEKVLVNAEDPAIRENRFALLKAIYDLYADRVADLSKIKIQ